MWKKCLVSLSRVQTCVFKVSYSVSFIFYMVNPLSHSDNPRLISSEDMSSKVFFSLVSTTPHPSEMHLLGSPGNCADLCCRSSHFNNYCSLRVPLSLFFFNFYCYSITVVCIFSPPLPPTPAKHTSLPCFHPPPWVLSTCPL